MSLTTFDEVVDSLCTTLQDYRQGEVKPIDEQHVRRWLNQFEVGDRPIIAAEMASILKKRYISPCRMKLELGAKIDEVLELYSEFDWEHIEFLDIQPVGSSQNQLRNELFSEHLHYNPYCVEPKIFVYLDDCIFSGRSLVQHIKDWIESYTISNVHLHLAFHAVHLSGLTYAKKQLDPLFERRDIQCKWHYHKLFQNLCDVSQSYDSLWPTETDLSSHAVDFVEYAKLNAFRADEEPTLFRPPDYRFEENLFTSPQGRQVVEKAFLTVGTAIWALAKLPNEHLPPLGYGRWHSFGFGAIYATYRNVANNCPLALWWGNPTAPKNSPLSRWYPLLLRRFERHS